MDPSLQVLLRRLDQLTEEFRELREGVQKAILVAQVDPERALTRARKVLEYVVRDVYQRRLNEPPGTRPLENLLQRLVKEGFLPDRAVLPCGGSRTPRALVPQRRPRLSRVGVALAASRVMLFRAVR
jgi:hypothetical protein